MALVVEDGTGLSTAESYESVDNLKAYKPRGGLSIPAGTSDATLEAALVRGSAAVDMMFGDRWPAGSYRQTEGQALDWPRVYAWDRDWYPLTGVPVGVKHATCEATLVELNSPGALSESASIGIKSETIGPITTVYAGASSARAMAYPAIKAPLSNLLRCGTLMGRS